jgi:hypothetical protein
VKNKNLLRRTLFFTFSVKNKIKKIFSISGLSFIFLSFAQKVWAVCPICTVGVAVGVGLSRWLGIDDTITGLWIGGLVVSMITWTLTWLEKKNIKFKGRAIVTIFTYYFLVVVPLYFTGIMGHPQNRLFCFCGFNFDKLLFGIIVGSFAFWFGAEWYYYLKKKNNGKAYFPFQKVVMPIAPLIILSIIFYFLTLPH